MKKEHPKDLIAAFVLGTTELDDSEPEVRAHLANCASCQQLAEQFIQVREVMPLLADQVPPPTRLRERILTAASPKTRSNPKKFVHLPSLFFKKPSLRPAWALLAVILLGLISWNSYLSFQLIKAQKLMATQTGVVQYQLTPSSPTLSSSHGQVLSLSQQQLILINLQGMPQPESGKVYQLWLKNASGQLLPSQTFQPEADGSKLLLLNQNLAHYSMLALTMEPGPMGSSHPTEAPIMTTSLQSASRD